MSGRRKYAWATMALCVVLLSVGLHVLGVFSAGSVTQIMGERAGFSVADRDAGATQEGSAATDGAALPTSYYADDAAATVDVVTGADGSLRASHQVIVSSDSSDPSAVAASASAAGISCSAVEAIATDLFAGETQYLLTYEGEASAEEVGALLCAAGVVSISEPNYASVLAADDEQGAGTDGVSSLAATSTNDQYLSSQWQLSYTRATAAWDVAKVEGAVTIAVIDSGVDTDHPDLVDNLLLEFAKNTDTNKLGADAVEDTIGHGTSVVGVLAASTNNEIGVAGSSYNAKVLPIKATTATGMLYNADLIEGLVYVTNLRLYSEDENLRNIRVINMSCGSNVTSVSYENAVKQATEAGILVVAAAGNGYASSVQYPAKYDGVIGVSSLKESDNADGVAIASSSNIGPEIDLSAPGDSVYTTKYEAGYGYRSGTSFASPLVAGAAALLFSMDPDATPAEIEGVLEASAHDLGAEGKDDYYGYGSLDMGAAVIELLSQEGALEAAPTCTTDGSYLRVVDGETVSAVIPALGHDELVAAPEAKATCAEPGCAARSYCSRCGETISGGEELPALGHDYVPTTTEPKCTEPGKTIYECSRCFDGYEETIDALGHDWSEWNTVAEPTCSEAGLRSRTCSRCPEVDSEAIPRIKSDIERFVERLYENVLGREADEAGCFVQIAAIEERGAAQVVFNFFNSEEYAAKAATMTNEEQVELVYQTLFNRAADEEGLALWTSYLDNGMSVLAIVAGFAESSEFVAMCDSFNVPAGSADYLRDNLLESRDKNPGVTAFASRLYQIVLGRAPEAAGLNVQTEALMSGTPCYQIALNFFASAEFVAFGYDDAQVLAVAYEAILGRAGTATEIDAWIARIDAEGLTTTDVVMGFCQSDEFEEICHACGMTSGMR